LLHLIGRNTIGVGAAGMSSSSRRPKFEHLLRGAAGRHRISGRRAPYSGQLISIRRPAAHARRLSSRVRMPAGVSVSWAFVIRPVIPIRGFPSYLWYVWLGERGGAEWSSSIFVGIWLEDGGAERSGSAPA
jgi:hypothetical protein